MSGSMVRGLLLVLLLALFSGPAQADPVRVTLSPATDQHPTWTLDGQHIVFESNRSGAWHLYKIPAAGGAVEQLTFGSGEIHPSISPDGAWIVFAAGEPDPYAASGLRRIPVAGGAETVIIASGGLVNYHPTWTPDGSTIYFDRRAGSNWNIMKVPASGGAAILVVDQGADARAEISPDGTRFARALDVGSAYNAVESPVDDPGDLVQLTFETANTTPEAYHPFSNKLLISSRKISGQIELFELDLATLVQERRTFDVGNHPFDPQNQLAAYSPDGTRIAYSSRRLTGESNIWLLETGVVPPEVTVLEAGDGAGLPKGNPVTVPLSLTSSDAAAALEFRLVDLPELVGAVSVTAVGRAAGMTVSFTENPDLHVLVYSADGKMIPPGFGNVLEVGFSVNAGAAEGDSASLHLDGVVLADPAGAPLPVTPVDGRFIVARLPGDINGDNWVDVGDLVRLIEIILGIGDPASPEELDAADCVADGDLNALDIVCLVSLSLDPAGGATGFPAPESVDRSLILSTREEVCGLQLDFPAGTRVGKDDGLAEFSLRGVSGEAGVRVLLFAENGGGLAPGDHRPVRATRAPVRVRAYGAGGHPLPAQLDGYVLSVASPTPAGLRFLPARPNPVHTRTTLRFVSPVTGTATLRILDVRGRVIEFRSLRVETIGEQTVAWSPHADRTLAAGVYFSVVRIGDHRATGRLVVLPAD